MARKRQHSSAKSSFVICNTFRPRDKDLAGNISLGLRDALASLYDQHSKVCYVHLQQCQHRQSFFEENTTGNINFDRCRAWSMQQKKRSMQQTTIDKRTSFCFPSLLGSIFSRILGRLWGDKEVRILILGLDGAGKTTILYRLQVGEVVTTIPSKTQLLTADNHRQ